MSSTFFAGARNTEIGPGSSFQNVEGDIHHHYISGATYQEEEESRVMPRQKRYREIFEGDVLLGKQTWSREMEVVIRQREPKANNTSSRDGGKTRVAVVKRFHTATLYPHSYTVTVMSFEPKDKKNKDTTRLVSPWWVDWTFNLKTRTWHYDASASVKQPYEDYHYAPAPLPEGPLPQLDADEITTYFENTFGD
ncbi:hypothetical protein PM082_019766 [Marasmius tenuissimus]|nr:hypothetical protein PM082_019766 [Marasmius tenuissimus]